MQRRVIFHVCHRFLSSVWRASEHCSEVMWCVMLYMRHGYRTPVVIIIITIVIIIIYYSQRWLTRHLHNWNKLQSLVTKSPVCIRGAGARHPFFQQGIKLKICFITPGPRDVHAELTTGLCYAVCECRHVVSNLRQVVIAITFTPVRLSDMTAICNFESHLPILEGQLTPLSSGLLEPLKRCWYLVIECPRPH